MFRFRRFAWLGVAAAGLLAGCGPDLPATEPVSGTIVYRGKPVAEAEVAFLCDGQRPGRGKTDAEGRFELTTYYSADYDALKGAIPGEYKVKVTKMELLMKPGEDFAQFMARTDGTPPKSLIPVRYGDQRTTDLTATVTEDGENHFELVLVD